MYKIYADNTLIYDSTLEDYKIGKGTITLEINKSGLFVFSIYPEHFYYDNFIRLKTVITVYKSSRIVFRGRILNDVTDYWNNKVLTCEGELGFLQDSIIRPFSFSGTPEELFKIFIEEHNAQVDEFKRFKIGTVTVIDTDDYISRSNSTYESTLSNLNSGLLENSLGGYFYITHGDNGADPIPTIHYLVDFTKVSTQKIEFGSNLKDYIKTVNADEVATVIIPLGAEVDDDNDTTQNPRLTIESVNDGKDFVYSKEGVALYGWITKSHTWEDVTVAKNLKTKAEAYLENMIQQHITIELNAIDLHLVDKSIESFNVCDYIQVISKPHNFDSILLCNKQRLDLLNPGNDVIVLGYNYTTFTESTNKVSASLANIVHIQTSVKNISSRLSILNQTVTDTEQMADEALKNYEVVDKELSTVSGDLEVVAGVVTENARNIATNAENIAKNAENIVKNAEDISFLAPIVLFEVVETIPTEGLTEVQTGKCDISIYPRIKVYFKDFYNRLSSIEIYKEKSSNVSTFLGIYGDTRFLSSMLTFANNEFTLGLSTLYDITSSIVYNDKEARYLSVYCIEGYKC